MVAPPPLISMDPCDLEQRIKRATALLRKESQDKLDTRKHDRRLASMLFLNLCLIAGVVGLGGDATASGRLSWLERGGHCFEPIRKPGGLSQNQALF